ncbi:EspA/EspE family type VII secretion system effector [Mycobacterium sp. 050134]|uniref:EspA/EspE family type VII secretion system effector n=1 Tax=Mycobacterium sp. 050134 TaxID=3096111 RepID=UPI002ED86F1A
MSILADAARVLSNLANFGSQFIGLDSNVTPSTSSSAGGPEYLAGNIAGMTGGLGSSLNSRQIVTKVAKWGKSLEEWDNKFMMRGAAEAPEWRIKFHDNFISGTAHKAGVARNGSQVAFGEVEKSNTGASVNILPWTATIVGYLELLTGFGPPNEGNDLKAGAQLWGTLRERLESAIPDENWQGVASETFAAQVVALRDIAQTLADLDGQQADIVADQAEWVTHFRLGFGILLNLLAVAIIVEAGLRIALALVPSGPAWTTAWAIAASSLAIAAALGMLGALIGLSVENASKADDVTSQIDHAGARAAQIAIASTTRSEVSAVAESLVSDFRVLATGPSAIPVASATQSARQKVTQEEPDRGATGASETPASPQRQDEQLDHTSNVTMPTLGGWIQMSKRAEGASGQARRHTDSLNPVTGQQRRPDPASPLDSVNPGDDWAAGADAFESPSAAAGTDATARAPIDLTGRSEPTAAVRRPR